MENSREGTGGNDSLRHLLPVVYKAPCFLSSSHFLRVLSSHFLSFPFSSRFLFIFSLFIFFELSPHLFSPLPIFFELSHLFFLLFRQRGFSSYLSTISMSFLLCYWAFSYSSLYTFPLLSYHPYSPSPSLISSHHFYVITRCHFNFQASLLSPHKHCLIVSTASFFAYHSPF